MIARNVQRCPVREGFDPLDERFLNDPIAAMRDPDIASTAVFYAPSIGCYVVTRYADMKAIFRDPVTFSNVDSQIPLVPLCAEARTIMSDGGKPPYPSIASSDGSAHARLRTPAVEAFGPRRVAAMEPLIQARIDQLLDAIDDSTPFEVVASFARPLPIRTIFILCGIPESDWSELIDWCNDRAAFSFGRPGPEEQVESAKGMVAYRHYLLDFVQEKAAGPPTDDLTSELIAKHQDEPDALELAEIASILFSLTFAGHETTSVLISNALLHLLSERSRWQELVADPSLIPRAVSETLRYDSSAPLWRRLATRDTVVGGTAIPAGSKIMMWLQAAGRDEAVWPDPDVFDLHRRGTNRALSLGLGAHYCIGASLGRIQVALALQALIVRMPDLQLVADRRTTFNSTLNRGVRTLWVERGSNAVNV